MKLHVLGCFGGDLKGRFPSFLINQATLLDAGTIGTALSHEDQLRIRSILLTHHHIDHLLGIPFYADAIYGRNSNPIKIYGQSEVLSQMKKHLLNDVLWPDFTKLPSIENPTLQLVEVEDGQIYSCDSTLNFMPISTCHTCVSNGYLLAEGNICFIYSGDTGPCEMFWDSIKQYLKTHPSCRIGALLIECSFPNRMTEFAIATQHLTPHLLQIELDKLGMPGIRVLIFHMKPQFISEIEREIDFIETGTIELVAPNQEFEF